MKCHCCEGEYKDHEVKDVYICTVCKHIFRKFDGDVIEYHAEKYRQSHPVYNNSERMKYVKNIINAIKPYLNKEHTCIEIGSAEGTFSQQILPYVKSVECCELDKNLCEKTKQLNFTTYNQDYLTLKNEYDVVIGFDVLEHILDLQKFYEHVSTTIKHKLILQVPVKRKIRPPNPEFDGHSHYFTEESIKKLFEKEFEVEYLYVSGYRQFARGPEMLVVLKKRK